VDVMLLGTSSGIAIRQLEEQSRNQSLQSKLMDYNDLVCKMKQEFNEIQKRKSNE
jgi:hypothetical protein